MKLRKNGTVPAKPVNLSGAKGVEIRLLIHQPEKARNFYMRQFTLAAAGHTPKHTHDWEHEVFVLGGTGAVVGPSGEKPLEEGDAVFVPANEEHQFKNTGKGIFTFLCVVPSTAG